MSVFESPAPPERAIRTNLGTMYVVATTRYDGRLGDKNKRLALTIRKRKRRHYWPGSASGGSGVCILSAESEHRMRPGAFAVSSVGMLVAITTLDFEDL